jgi:hypothetical protein
MKGSGYGASFIWSSTKQNGEMQGYSPIYSDLTTKFRSVWLHIILIWRKRKMQGIKKKWKHKTRSSSSPYSGTITVQSWWSLYTHSSTKALTKRPIKQHTRINGNIQARIHLYATHHDIHKRNVHLVNTILHHHGLNNKRCPLRYHHFKMPPQRKCTQAALSRRQILD